MLLSCNVAFYWYIFLNGHLVLNSFITNKQKTSLHFIDNTSTDVMLAIHRYL